MIETVFEREHNSIFQTYKRLPIVVDHAEGCRIWDIDGNCWLDFLSGIAVNALGYGNDRVLSAIRQQIEKYMHVSNYFYQEPQIQLAEKLKALSGFDRVFFSNSGTEAIEGAIKLARRWGSFYKKSEIIAFKGGFHGRTYGALSIMDKPLYKDKMGPFLDGALIVEYNNTEELLNCVSEKTAAVALEFIQGEGGVTTASDEFVKSIFALKEKFGFIVIADEIQAGGGRTGKFLGFQHYSVKPDVVTMAKALGGGLPLGAILAREEFAGVWEKGMHGTTYGGNAVACAAGLACIGEIESYAMKNAETIGNYLKNELCLLKERFPSKILEVRGIGLFLGLLLSFDASIIVNSLLEKKIISNAASGTVLRIIPPLIITKLDADEFLEALEVCLRESAC